MSLVPVEAAKNTRTVTDEKGNLESKCGVHNISLEKFSMVVRLDKWVRSCKYVKWYKKSCI
jgi:hypothetical protein